MIEKFLSLLERLVLAIESYVGADDTDPNASAADAPKGKGGRRKKDTETPAATTSSTPASTPAAASSGEVVTCEELKKLWQPFVMSDMALAAERTKLGNELLNKFRATPSIGLADMDPKHFPAIKAGMLEIMATHGKAAPKNEFDL